MNILAPVNSLESAKYVISCGADELYLGADDGVFNTYSFTGRGKFSRNGLKVAVLFKEVEQIVEYAHQRKVKVNLLCNTPFVTDDDTHKMKNALLDYIERVMSVYADSLVVGDFGLLYLLRQSAIPIPIHASLYFRTLNKYQLNFFKELGVARVTLPYSIELDEISELVKANIVDLEVPGYLGCSFLNGACNCLHSLGEESNELFDACIACKSVYRIKDNETIEEGAFFDNELGCSACSLLKLSELGVKTLKIVGRDRDVHQIGNVIKNYKDVLNGLITPQEFPEDWKRIWCKKRRCKFLDNDFTRYYI